MVLVVPTVTSEIAIVANASTKERAVLLGTSQCSASDLTNCVCVIL